MTAFITSQIIILNHFCQGLVLQVDFIPKQQNETNIGKNVVNKFRTENKTETKTNIQDEEDVTLLTSLYHYFQMCYFLRSRDFNKGSQIS